MRLYIGKIYQNMGFNPASETPFRTRVKLSDGKISDWYEGDTPEDVLEQIKQDHQVYGEDYLDYAAPNTALEYALIREVMRLRGCSDAEFRDWVGIQAPESDHA